MGDCYWFWDIVGGVLMREILYQLFWDSVGAVLMWENNTGFGTV